MGKKEEVLTFLRENVFDPISSSPKASNILKQAIRLAFSRLNNKDAQGVIRYYTSSMIGDEKPTKFAQMMKAEGFTGFEEVKDEFREKFNEQWLKE